MSVFDIRGYYGEGTTIGKDAYLLTSLLSRLNKAFPEHSFKVETSTWVMSCYSGELSQRTTLYSTGADMGNPRNRYFSHPWEVEEYIKRLLTRVGRRQ